MDAQRVQLPGGLLRDGSLATAAELGPLTGHVEEALCDWREGLRPGPEGVDHVLQAARLRLQGQAPERGLAAALCVCDRQWLLLNLLRQADPAPWVSACCPACAATFDLQLRLDDWPHSAAGAGFPFARTTWQAQAVCLRVPTGADQARLVGMPAGAAALALLAACVVSVAGAPPAPGWVATLEPAAWLQFDQALDAVAPQLADMLATACPECGQAVNVSLAPHTLGPLQSERLFDEVCQLARHNHWGENDILCMPRARRLRYLDRIQRLQAGAA